MKKLIAYIAVFYLSLFPLPLHAQEINEAVVQKWAKHYVEQGFGMTVFTGYSFKTGKTSEYFSGSIPLGFDLYYQRNSMLYILESGFNFSKIKKPIAIKNNPAWPTRNAMSLYMELNTGYEIADSKIFKIIPTTGLGIALSGPINTKDNVDYRDAGLPYYKLGIITDIKIRYIEKDKTESRSSNTYIRLNIGRRAVFNRPAIDPYFKGSEYYISIGTGIMNW